MARVLPGTAPQVVAHGQADMRPAFAWIEAHSDAFRGQWIAVRLVDPVLVAQCPNADPIVADDLASCSKTVCCTISALLRMPTRSRGSGGTCERDLLHV